MTDWAVRCSAESQANRRPATLAAIRREIESYLRRQGDRVELDLGPHGGEARLVLWIARVLFQLGEEDQTLACRLLESLEWEPQCHFNSHFCGVAALGMLQRHKTQLTPALVEKLETYLQRYLSDWMTLDFRIHGANDNAGIECATIVALAGDYWKNPALTSFALERFDRPLRLLEGREYLHECNSPTYSAVALSTLAELGELTGDPTLRHVALRLEHHIWRELLNHFHPGIRLQIGPFSRAFTGDNAGQLSLVLMVLDSALGEVSPINPRSMLFPPPRGTFAHNSWLFQWASLGCLASVTYHPPVKLVEETFGRELPFTIQGSHEFSPMGESPGGWSTVQAHAEKEWALGWFGNRPCASSSVHLLCQRHPVSPDAPVLEHLAAVRGIYTRCQVSDRMANFHLRDASAIEKEVSGEDGAAFVVGQKGTLLLGYVPVHHPLDIRTIRASVVFPLHHSRPDEVWHGRDRVTGFSGSFPIIEWSFVRDGDIFLGIRPLLSRQHNAQFATQQYGNWDNYGTISVFNVAAFAALEFSTKELRAFGSGFVLEIATVHDGKTFSEFRESLLDASIHDFQWGGQRELRYCRDGVDLELIYDYENLSLRRAWTGDCDG